MIDNMQWLTNIERSIIENDGADLYNLIEIMYKEHKMNFLQFIYDASRGIGAFVSEGIEYVLDQDLDNPEDFDGVTFLVGDYVNAIISPEHFVELMQIISDSYVESYPKDKASIEHYMMKLRERYSKVKNESLSV